MFRLHNERLYEKWSRDEVRRLMRIIDWLVQFPKNMETKLQESNELLVIGKVGNVPTTYPAA